MGKLKRKFERKKAQKDKKEAKAMLKNKLKAFNMMPDNCSFCGVAFNRKSKKDHSTWHVDVYVEEIVLSCPKCNEQRGGTR